MGINRRKFLKGSLVAAAALPLIVDPAAAAQGLRSASQGSGWICSLLERVRRTETTVRSVHRARVNSYIASDYALAGERLPEIVWFGDLETFALELLRSPILIEDWDGLRVRTLVGGHFTWNGSLRYWQQFAQANEDYDWRRYSFLYDAIIHYLRHDCCDSIGIAAVATLKKVSSDPRWRGLFSDEQIDCAENAISSINSAGVIYAYAVSLMDAALISGVHETERIIKEMMMPIEAYESGFWFALVTADKLLCVERPKYI